MKALVRLIPFILIVLGLGVTAGTAGAQCNWSAEVERGLAVIERVRTPVEQSGIPEARELLTAAGLRLREAQERGRRGEIEFACRLARVAQSLATKAGEIALRGLRGLEELERMLQRTDEMVQESTARLRALDEKAGRAFMGSAKEQQNEAWSAFRNRRPRLSLKLTLMARESVHRALRQAGVGPGPDGVDVALELEQTDRLLAEARRLGEEDATGFEPALLASAERLQAQAHRRLSRAQPGLALAFTQESRALVRRALGEADLLPDAAEVTSLLESTALLVERLSADATEAGNDRALDLLRRARELLDQGMIARDQGNWREALASARGASALTLDAADRLEPIPGP